MARHYILAPRAAKDIENIFFYTLNHWGMVQAEKYVSQLKQSMQRLAKGEIAGKSCQSAIGELGAGSYYYHQGRHYIIYREHPIGIEVIALYHDRMNLADHLQTLV